MYFQFKDLHEDRRTREQIEEDNVKLVSIGVCIFAFYAILSVIFVTILRVS